MQVVTISPPLLLLQPPGYGTAYLPGRRLHCGRRQNMHLSSEAATTDRQEAWPVIRSYAGQWTELSLEDDLKFFQGLLPLFDLSSQIKQQRHNLTCRY
jgi:hypothetical protein